MNKKLLKLKVTNLYLLRAGEKYLLVDTGYEYEWELFCQRLAEASVRLDEIGWVLITHHHDDHSGLLNKIVAANPGVKVILSGLGKGYLATGEHFHTPEAGYVNKRIGLLLSLKGRFDKKWTHAFPAYKIRENDFLIRGDTSFEELGIPLAGRILETPGHSPDHLSVVFDDGDCLAGDAAANFLQWAGAKYCVISVDNLDQYYTSWKKLISSGAKRIFPSHGKLFTVDALKQNLGKHKKEGMVLFVERCL
ncbi:MAG TPA: MBL fold metallo-hydrolase [Terriglobia bacterium]|nr:MBL fold metallo-hydrolase [Terriglobia bacterium]